MEFKEIEAGQSKEMPAKMVIYGVPKIGKTRFASQAEDVFFLNIEGGLNYLDKKVRTTPKLEKFDEVIDWLKYILENDKFTCGTISVDSVDWLESLAIAKIEAIHGKSITDKKYEPFTYGNNYLLVANECCRMLTALDMIYKKKGIKAILIAHSQLREISTPLTDPYSRYELKFFSKGFGHKINEWADLTLFADKVFHVADEGMKTSEPKPMILASNSAGYIGGGRMVLGKNLPLSYEAVRKEITGKEVVIK